LASKGQGCQTLGPYTAYIPRATTYPSVCAPRTRINEHSLKIKHSRKEHKPSYSLLTYSKRQLKTHTHSSYLSRKSKTQRYRNVTHSLVRRKAELGTLPKQEIQETTTQIHISSHISCKPTHGQSFYYSYIGNTQNTRNSKAYTCHSRQ